MSSTKSLLGTSNQNFQIGLRGPVIYTGSPDPSVTPPTPVGSLAAGDLYLRDGSSGRPWIYDGTAWDQIVVANAAGDVTIDGDLTVSGTTTTIDTTNLAVTDNTIIINDGEAGAGVTLGSAGIEVDRGSATNTALVWDETDDQWEIGLIGSAPLAVRQSNGINASVIMSTTDAIQVASGTSGQRPSTPVNGMIRYNTTNSQFEGYNAGWGDLGGAGDLISTNNLSDLANIATARTNLGLVAGGVGDIWVEKAGDTMTGDLTMDTGAQVLGDGTAGVTAPAYSFDNDPNTGMYQRGTDEIGWSTDGVERLILNSTTLQGSGTAQFSNGIEILPTYTFASDTDTGMFRSAENTLGFSAGGFSRLRIQPNSAGANASVIVEGSDAFVISRGTTAQRPSSPVDGMIRYNTTEGVVEGRIDGAWTTIGGSTITNPLTIYSFTATAAQTVFSGVDSNAQTLSYVAGQIIVSINGAVQDVSEYTAVNGTSVTLTTAANLNDIVQIISWEFGNTFSIADVVPASTGGTFNGGVSFAAGATISGGNLSVANDISVTGEATFADGLVSTPSITFTTDTDTGIYRPLANVIGFTTAGVDRLQIRNQNGSNATFRFLSNDAIELPDGTTAQRPSTPVNGMIRYNTTDGTFEGYAGGSWGPLGGAGATGGGTDEIFYENDQTVTTDYTITNGKNAMSAGPITINSGVTVTVGTGETWTIV